jgi:transposase
LFWDRDGFCVLMKKLEAGTFRRVKTAEGVARVEIDAGELAMLLEGIDAPKVRRRKRYVLRENEHNDAGLRDPPC